MSEGIQHRIIAHLKSETYRPQQPRGLARELHLDQEPDYAAFREALRELESSGRVTSGARGAVMLPGEQMSRDEFIGTYRHNRRGFGFVVPIDPKGREDLYISEGENSGALSGDIVKARITNRGFRDGKPMHSGRITQVIKRTQTRFVGSLIKQGAEWLVLPDGNAMTEPIRAPDAAARHIKVGTKVVVELTSYPGEGGERRGVGVITEVLGAAGEKDVDLRGVIVQHNLPGDFPDEVKQQARHALDTFDPGSEQSRRVDLSDQVICTIDPDDAKDYDDAISLRELDNGNWELAVHIADVSYFVPEGSALDLEAAERGNSCYFPGHVIPMLPEVLSNGVCSLQEGVPRFCKSAFITYDEGAKPISAKFANTIIRSRKRFRYREAQAILDAIGPSGSPLGATGMKIDLAAMVPHPDGERCVGAYDPETLELLAQMNVLAHRLQKRRTAQGQMVLDLPEVDLVLDDEGKVIDAVPEDQSFTHTLIEMFMVEANEAVARLLDSLQAPFMRRTHPDPETAAAEKLRNFVHVAGLKLPKVLDRKALQSLLAAVKGKPEAFAINLAVLKSLTRAEYSPEPIGHYALASEHYCHFTSPIRRYADLLVHRLLDLYLDARLARGHHAGGRAKIDLDQAPSFDDLVEIGRHLCVTERRADDAERELRKVKLLELLSKHIGDEFTGVVTSVTNFGLFIQLSQWLVDGLIRYEHLLNDRWDVDDKAGLVRGQRTGQRIGIGDVVQVIVVRVDVARRELDLSITRVVGRARNTASASGRPSSGSPSSGQRAGARSGRNSSKQRAASPAKATKGKIMPRQDRKKPLRKAGVRGKGS